MTAVRVAYLVTTLDVGGAERSLLEVLRRIDRDRVRPLVCSLVSGGRLRDAFAELGIPVIELEVEPGLAELRAIGFVDVLRHFRPSIVHSRLILSNLWARLGALFGAKVVCEERGLAVERPKFMTVVNRATLGFCSMNVANSRAVAARMRSRDGISNARLRLVYGGVDCERFSPAPADAPPPFDIVTTTRLEVYKGILDMLDAFKLVAQRRPGTRLSIVGDGSQRAAVERKMADLGLGTDVTLWGEQSDVAGRLREASLFMLSSHEEGLPNSVMEAMACGLPVVATSVGGTPELVEEGTTGMLVPPRQPQEMAEAILRYLDAPDLRMTHGLAGRARAQVCFNIQATARAYESLYTELVR